MKKSVTALVLALSLLFLLAGCAKFPMTGTWQEEGTEATVVFNNNGTVSYAGKDVYKRQAPMLMM